jgi:D-3-phosphoglycerate dehydrogenase
MEMRLPETVNLVNAPALARSRGIRVTEERSTQPTDYASLITASVRTHQEERSVSGTIFHGVGPRIIQINDYRVDVLPEGHAIVVEQIDRPGIIGRVGTLLGQHGINIAFMQVGRKEIGGRAVMVIMVDTPAPPELLEQIRQSHEAILDVHQVDFGPPLSTKTT